MELVLIVFRCVVGPFPELAKISAHAPHDSRFFAPVCAGIHGEKRQRFVEMVIGDLELGQNRLQQVSRLCGLVHGALVVLKIVRKNQFVEVNEKCAGLVVSLPVLGGHFLFIVGVPG